MTEQQTITTLRMLDEIKSILRNDGYAFNDDVMIVIDEFRDEVRAGIDVEVLLTRLRQDAAVDKMIKTVAERKGKMTLDELFEITQPDSKDDLSW